MINTHIFKFSFVICFCSFLQKTYANNSVTSANCSTKIMVIPYVKRGRFKNNFENDVNKRIALTKIKEAFDSRGFTTVDFVAKLKSAKDNNIFTSDNQTDIKDQIIQMSGADIYVEAEVNENHSNSGNSVNLVAQCLRSFHRNSLLINLEIVENLY